MLFSRILAAFHKFFTSGAGITATTTATGTAAYVVYKDQKRNVKMMAAFSKGAILPPLSQNHNEVQYYRRPLVEKRLEAILSPEFSNEYYLITGEVGAGKTRSVLEVIRKLINTSGTNRLGAPVYVTASQGNNFPNSLAKAVNFAFDEHISFKAFLDIIMKTHSVPQRDDNSKLHRVLDAIEETSFKYAQQSGRPVVLVIDGINWLQEKMPHALPLLQEKAKLWADANVVKLVLITNDEQTEITLHRNRSAWSRAGTLLTVDELSDEEAINFLTMTPKQEVSGVKDKPLSISQAQDVVNVVGGRLHRLIIFRRLLNRGMDFQEIKTQMKLKEREKFVGINQHPAVFKVLKVMRDAGEEGKPLSHLEAVSPDVHILLGRNVLRFDRHEKEIMVKFQSRLTKEVVKEITKDGG